MEYYNEEKRKLNNYLLTSESVTERYPDLKTVESGVEAVGSRAKERRSGEIFLLTFSCFWLLFA